MLYNGDIYQCSWQQYGEMFFFSHLCIIPKAISTSFSWNINRPSNTGKTGDDSLIVPLMRVSYPICCLIACLLSPLFLMIPLQVVTGTKSVFSVRAYQVGEFHVCALMEGCVMMFFRLFVNVHHASEEYIASTVSIWMILP